MAEKELDTQAVSGKPISVTVAEQAGEVKPNLTLTLGATAEDALREAGFGGHVEAIKAGRINLISGGKHVTLDHRLEDGSTLVVVQQNKGGAP